MSNSFDATFKVTVDSRYGESESFRGGDLHDVTISLGGVDVFTKTFTEAPDRHHGDENWDPVAHFGKAGLDAFAYVLSRIVDSFENGS